MGAVRTVWSSFESKKRQLYAQTCLEGLRDVLLPLALISEPCLPYVVPSMGPIVLVVASHGQQNLL